MKTYLDCYPCFLRQALSATRRAGDSKELQQEILVNAMEQLKSLPSGTTPPEIAYTVHNSVWQKTPRTTYFSNEKVKRLLQETGFNNLTWVQTLFCLTEENNVIEPIISDYSQGAFVVVKGQCYVFSKLFVFKKI